jgi:hypothetical protein
MKEKQRAKKRTRKGVRKKQETTRRPRGKKKEGPKENRTSVERQCHEQRRQANKRTR